ncbi:MAG: tRNA (adenosine(37)-N6)-threonylcarbamoyltransferase complex dimerization subunit type 1 TsaB [Alphaproteobacteria bacterium]|nr:tRNA (adenosine(37)-N6)-threonylcarbamoyltransferase complex dimerization subunit type 1 TsaB [Alphaproteobacteria bacterium]
MYLIINTSGKDIELLLNDKYLKIQAEKQAIGLPTAVKTILEQNNTTMADLTAVGVVVGPGSFTGIRMGIAYAKGLSIGLNIPVIPITAFDLYLYSNPDAFVAIDSGKGDFFVATKTMAPCIMDIDTVETEQMKCPQTVGHLPFDLTNAIHIVKEKLNNKNTEPVIPLYLRPSYVEK